MYIRYLDILLPSDLNKRYINLILFENWCSIYLIKKKVKCTEVLLRLCVFVGRQNEVQPLQGVHRLMTELLRFE